MSYVHLLIIKDDNLYLVSTHYRTAKKLLEKGVDKILPALKSRYLDAGYIVLDLNKGVVFNGQNAFAANTKLYVIEA